MSQRNPLNERYQEDNHTGKTRKSAASAKPATKAASSVHEPAGKSKKQKKAEQQERDRKIRERRGNVGANITENELRKLPEYKRLRRIWWVCLGLSIILTASTWIYSTVTGAEEVSLVPLVFAWIFLIIAFYIDLWKIRQLRNRYKYDAGNDKSKAVRAQQKKNAAELRERRKQEALNPQPEKPSLFNRIMGAFDNLFNGSKKSETGKSAKKAAEKTVEAADKAE